MKLNYDHDVCIGKGYLQYALYWQSFSSRHVRPDSTPINVHLSEQHGPSVGLVKWI